MLERLLRIFPWAIGLIVIANLLFLDFVWLNKPQNEKVQTPIAQPETASNSIDCSSCQKIITDEIAKEVAKITPVIEKQTIQPTIAPKYIQMPTNPPQAKVIYVPVGTSGSTTNMDWTDIAATDFYFNFADYSQAKSASFQSSLQSFPSQDKVSLRLYDVTNNRAVDGSELTTDSVSYALVTSGTLSIWQGNNLYRIQGKGINGNTLNFSNSKLRINF
jgi:hypothetical protein